MPFSATTIKEAWERCNGVCECTDTAHGHAKRCSTRLFWIQGGELGAAWKACRKKTTWGPDTLENCQIRCARCLGAVVKPME